MLRTRKPVSLHSGTGFSDNLHIGCFVCARQRLSNGTTWASSSAARPIAKCGHQHGCAVVTCLLYKMWIGQTYSYHVWIWYLKGMNVHVKYQLFSSSQGRQGFDPMPYVFAISPLLVPPNVALFSPP